MQPFSNNSQITKKETLTQVFSCELCEILKNTFFYRTPLVAASGFNCLTHADSNQVAVNKYEDRFEQLEN